MIRLTPSQANKLLTQEQRKAAKKTPAQKELSALERNKLENDLYGQIKLAGLDDGLETQYRWNPDREWKADFAYPDLKIIIEINGGSHIQGRHNRHKGYEEDLEKANQAQLSGWLYLSFTGDMVRDGRAVDYVYRALLGRSKK